jgi:hypothetical protein
MSKARTNGATGGQTAAAEKRQTKPGARTKELASYLVDSGIDVGAAHSAANLFAKEFKLGNIQASDRRAVRYLAKNIVEFVDCEHPPEDSNLQGPYRAAMLGDMSERHTVALSDSDKIQLESALMAFTFDTSRSEGGFQQDKVSDTTQERRKVESGGDGGGLLGGLFS